MRFLKLIFLLLIVRPWIWFFLGLNRYSRLKVPRSGPLVLVPNRSHILDYILIFGLLPITVAIRTTFKIKNEGSQPSQIDEVIFIKNLTTCLATLRTDIPIYPLFLRREVFFVPLIPQIGLGEIIFKANKSSEEIGEEISRSHLRLEDKMPENTWVNS